MASVTATIDNHMSTSTIDRTSQACDSSHVWVTKRPKVGVVPPNRSLTIRRRFGGSGCPKEAIGEPTVRAAGRSRAKHGAADAKQNLTRLQSIGRWFALGSL